MSWDIHAIRAPGNVRRLEDLPVNHTPRVIGQADSIVATIREAVPDVDVTDPTWLVVRSGDQTIEISLGKGAQVHSITFYVDGDERAVPVVLDLSRRLAVTPFDTESGDVITASSTPPTVAPPDDDEESGGKRRWWQRGGGD